MRTVRTSPLRATCLKQTTLGPCVVQIWSRPRGTPRGRKPAYSTEWILEILYCSPKGRRALLRIPSTEGRSGCLCWAKSKPKGPKKVGTPKAKFTRRGSYNCLQYGVEKNVHVSKPTLLLLKRRCCCKNLAGKTVRYVHLETTIFFEKRIRRFRGFPLKHFPNFIR